MHYIQYLVYYLYNNHHRASNCFFRVQILFDSCRLHISNHFHTQSLYHSLLFLLDKVVPRNSNSIYRRLLNHCTDLEGKVRIFIYLISLLHIESFNQLNLMQVMIFTWFHTAVSSIPRKTISTVVISTNQISFALSIVITVSLVQFTRIFGCTAIVCLVP